MLSCKIDDVHSIAPAQSIDCANPSIVHNNYPSARGNVKHVLKWSRRIEYWVLEEEDNIFKDL